MISELSLVVIGKGSNIMCGDQLDYVLQYWIVDILIDEYEGLIWVKVWLCWWEKELVGVGLVRFNLVDCNVFEIGDEFLVV